MSATPPAADDTHTCQVALRADGPVARITLSSRSGLNLLTGPVLERMEGVCRELACDAETRAVIVHAEGPHFCGGLDLRAHRAVAESDLTLQQRRRLAERGGRMIDALMAVPQPVVCAINGVAAGGGACIAAACDFRIAAQDARIGYPEALRGLNLGWHAIGPCLRLVGPARAKRMILLGKLESAPTLAGWGFVDEVVAADRLQARTAEFAEELAAVPPVAAQMVKKSINVVAHALDAAIMHMDSDQFLLAAASEDSREATAAFAAGPPPPDRGR